MITNAPCPEWQDIAASLEGVNIQVVGNHIIVPGYNDPGKLHVVLDRIPHKCYHHETCSRYRLELQNGHPHHWIIVPRPFLKPVFSVLIPFRDHAGEVVRAVKSVQVQTFQSFEVILINDGSEEQYIKEIMPLLRSGRVKLIDNPVNYGTSVSLNTGLLQARGDYILQIDADDWLAQNALEEVYGLFRKHGYAAVYGYPLLDGDLRHIPAGYPKQGSHIRRDIDFFSYYGLQAPRAYETAALKAVGGYSVNDSYTGRLYEDRLTLSRVAERYPVGYLEKPVYHVWVKGESLSRKDPLKTSSAKLSILVNEANKRQLALTYTCRHTFLEASFTERLPGKCSASWSVIIPFFRSPEHLRLTLKSWEEAIAYAGCAGSVEVVIVNDAADQELHRCEEEFGFVKIVRTGGGKGPSYTRNLGLKYTVGQYLFFCDEDHIVPPDVLCTHEQIHAAHSGEALVIGSVWGRRVLYDLHPGMAASTRSTLLRSCWFRKEFDAVSKAFAAEDQTKLFEPVPGIYAACFDYSFTDQQPRDWGRVFAKHSFNLADFEHAWLKCETGNLSISREQLYAVGLFNEQLRAMEGWELGIRAMSRSLKIVMAPFAEPFHIVHRQNLAGQAADSAAAAAYLRLHYPEHVTRALAAAPLESIVDPVFNTQRKDARDETPLPPQEPRICLTFNGGPDEYGTNRLLDFLQEMELQATFFVMGGKILFHRTVMERMVKEGHETAIYSWHQHSYDRMACNVLLRQINRARDLLQQLAARPVNLVRPPAHMVSDRMVQLLMDNGYRIMGWHSCSGDAGRGISHVQMISNIATGGIMNKVLLFHNEVHEPQGQLKALKWLRDLCRERSISAVTGTEYMDSNRLKHLLTGFNPLND